MVRFETNGNWTDAVHAIYKRGEHLFEGVESITCVTIDEFFGNYRARIYGQYDPWTPAVLLREDTYQEQAQTILHELGHHRHYTKLFGYPKNRCDSRDEWYDAFDDWYEDSPMDSVYDAEMVADTFADYHLGHIECVPDKYYDAGGPELGEPIATDIYE